MRARDEENGNVHRSALMPAIGLHLVPIRQPRCGPARDLDAALVRRSELSPSPSQAANEHSHSASVMACSSKPGSQRDVVWVVRVCRKVIFSSTCMIRKCACSAVSLPVGPTTIASHTGPAYACQTTLADGNHWGRNGRRGRGSMLNERPAKVLNQLHLR